MPGTEWHEARRRGKKLKRPLRRFLFRIAATLGMTVSEVCERMSSTELNEWMALVRLDPWGPFRDDLRGAIGAWAATAAWSKNSRVTDFLIRDAAEESQPATVAAARAYLKALRAGHG